VAELRPHADEFEKAGATLAVIGNGWPAMAKSWATHVGFPPSVSVLTDPSGKAYDVAGLKRSTALTFSPFAALRWLRANLHGFRQGKTAGNAWQQGGALIVLPGGKVPYRYVSMGPGDHPAPGKLLAALQKAA
jgi:hypothetical protein